MLCRFENPCESRKKIVEEETLIITLGLWRFIIMTLIITILMTLGFLILMLNACWNNLWCYKDIWGSFKKNKDNFLFFWVKLKVAFRNTIFWSWVWALIYTNHFCNMELIECKAYSASICISIPFSNVGRFFQKISITKSWTELLRQNRRSIFQWKNPSPPKSMLFAKI